MKAILAILLATAITAAGQSNDAGSVRGNGRWLTNDLSVMLAAMESNGWINVIAHTNADSRSLRYTITTTVTTNRYAPKQYQNISTVVMGCRQAHSFWQDEPLFFSETRDNPDIRVEEIHSIRRLEFDFEGKHYVELLEDKIVSTRKFTRSVAEEWKEAK